MGGGQGNPADAAVARLHAAGENHVAQSHPVDGRVRKPSDAGRNGTGSGNGSVARECSAEVLAGLAEPYVLLHVAQPDPLQAQALVCVSRVEETKAGDPNVFSRVKVPLRATLALRHNWPCARGGGDD